MMDEKYLKHFDETITEEIENFAYERALSQSRYIFIEKKKGQYIGHCTNCGEEFSLYTAKHLDKETCPVCKCTCEIRFSGYSRKYKQDQACFIRYDKSKVDNETLIARAFFVVRDYSGDYKNVKTKINEIARYIFLPNKSIMFERERWWNSYSEWYQCSSIHRYNRDSLARLNNYIDWNSLEKATKDNRFKYSMYQNMGYVDQYASMTKYFEFYNNYPIIERLMKIGFTNLIKTKLKGCSLRNCVNWRQKDDVFKFLRLNRAQVKDLVASGMNLTPDFINLYRKNADLKWKFTCEELKEIENLMNGWYRKDITYYTTWDKAFKYISKQFNKYKNWDSKHDVLITWIDYLFDCDQLKINAKEDKNALFPKDLFRQHQNFIAQIRYKADEKLKAGFEKQKKRREKLRFEFNGIISIPAGSQSELIEEGKAMGHCVGGYAEKCSKGETDIVFIRKKSEPDKAFVTMEVKKDEVIQVRAFRNGRPPKEVTEFVEQFKIQVLSKLSKKKSRKKVA